MPNFISEDDIEQAMMQRLQHLYGYDTLNCMTSTPRAHRPFIPSDQRKSRHLRSADGDLTTISPIYEWFQAFPKDRTRNLPLH